MIRATFAPDLVAVASDGDGARRAAGRIVPYDEPGATSAGRLTVAPDALTLPAELSRVKLLAGHDTESPVGYLESAESGPEGLAGVFKFGTTAAADQAYTELADGLRDGLSVELHDITETDGVITAGRLTSVAMVAVPAFDTARAVAAQAHDDTTDRGEAAMASEDTTTDTTTAPAMVAAPPAVEIAAARTKPVSAVQLMDERLRSGMFDRGPAGMTAALADITPNGNGAGNEMAALARQFYGELWDGKTYQTRYAVCFRELELTGAEVHGWQWVSNPKVADYPGNKTEIPTNPATLEEQTIPAQRIAGGHDIDRIYRDFPAAGFWASYWREMTENLAVRYDEKRLAHLDGLDAAPATAASLAEALAIGVADVPTATYALVAPDVAATTANTPVDMLPAALSPGNPFYYGGSLDIITAPDLGPGTVIVGDRSANAFYTIRPPVRVEAVNLAMGGIDAAVFGYWAALEISGGVREITVTAPAATAASKTK